MPVLNTPRNRTQVSFYDGPGYTPRQIGDWIAVTDRDLPWNTLGHALPGDGRSVDRLLTAAEVLAMSNLDIEVRNVPVFTAEGTMVPKVRVTGYDDPDTGDFHPFGAVSDRYEVVQPREALGFFDEVVASIDGAGYSAAWNMREKSMMGVTISLPQEIVVDPDGANDRTGLHLLGVNSFDGTTGISGVVTATRYFCLNQLNATLRNAKQRFSFRHTSRVRTRAAEAAAMVGLVTDYAAELDSVANGLYALPMTDGQFERFLNRLPVFTPATDDTDLVKGRILERRGEAIEAWNAPHNENIKGTRWGALNVVAEWAEWGRRVNGSHRTGTDATRQRAIGTLVSPHATAPVNMALEILTAMR